MEIEVAIPTPLDQTFTYESGADVPPGSRVLVPFGGRSVVGVSLGPAQAPQEKRSFKLKGVKEVIDSTPVYSPVILEIARWMSRYYMRPLGEVLRAMLPASSKKVVKRNYQLTEKGKELLSSQSAHADAQKLIALFGKRSELTQATLRKKLKTMAAEGVLDAKDVEATLRRRGFIRLAQAAQQKARGPRRVAATSQEQVKAESLVAQRPLVLTPSQGRIFDAIAEQGIYTAPEKPFLLWGLTGSGKTEIYLQLIAALDEQGEDCDSQTLVMVPEISLTPQMTRVFADRFPGSVAVVHSGMNDSDRWSELERIRQGKARILIGPRSAVFGPFKNLKLLIVDEEHDSSYKQATGLTYNGRDVAVLRGKLEKACVVLGSATPSLESYHNAKLGKYELLTLPERVSGRALPEVTLIPSKPAYAKGDIVGKSGIPQSVVSLPISDTVLQELEANLASGQQAIVLLNRRGYAFYLFSLNEKKAVSCPSCSVSLTMHRNSTQLRCHYCDHKTTTSAIVAANPTDEFIAVGYGSEKVETFLKQRLPLARIKRVDSDTVARKDVLPETLGEFRAGKLDILVGTQILAKGHDFPNVTLIVILEVDQLLDLPDFRAGEKTFQLIVQASGRAGRAEHPGRVLVQTGRGEHPVVKAGLQQDFLLFAGRELEFRKNYRYPPYVRMIAVEMNSTDRRELGQFCERIERWLSEIAKRHPTLPQNVKVSGPAVPPIEMIRGRTRRSLLFSSADSKPLHFIVQQFQIAFAKVPGDIRVKVDVDPQSLI